MSVKNYGIYLAYPPLVDLRHEGLGRYLAAFLLGASENKDVKFTLICPSWMRKSLIDLLQAEGVPHGSFKVEAPKDLPPILQIYLAWLKLQAREKGPGVFKRATTWFLRSFRGMLKNMMGRLVRAHNFVSLAANLFALFFLLAIYLVIFFPVILPMFLILFLSFSFGVMLRSARRILVFRLFLRKLRSLRKKILSPKDFNFALSLYDSLAQAEIERMARIIKNLHGVRAWYCPTAFWPSFNDVNAPRLMCVPDVVLGDFSVGFSKISGDRVLKAFSELEKSINGGQFFVTYSDSVKWDTLVDKYAISANNVSVINHAPNDLSKWITGRGAFNNDAFMNGYARALLKKVLKRRLNERYISGFANSDVKFLFYASQIRPNKNVITLLRAYEYLLRKRMIGHKLILTGHRRTLPEIDRFVKDHGLDKDVLFLPGLKIQELAALYHLADLAVNPSLSEGGCPFTFTEALSVGTPVVMADIIVAKEVLTEPELQDKMFFDPYDWQDMARRIEWALSHKQELLAVQTPIYRRLAQRRWQDVVQEHIDVLDRISNEKALP